MVCKLSIGLQNILSHEAVVQVRVIAMHPVKGEDFIQHIDEVTRPGDTQLDQQILQAYGGIEASHPLQRLAAEQQRRRRCALFAIEEDILEVQTPVSMALCLSSIRALSVDLLDAAGADADVGLVRQIGDLGRDTPGQHDVVRPERGDQASPGPGDGGVERPRQPLVGLHLKIESVESLQPADSLHTVIARTIVNDQQLNMGVSLRQDARDGSLYVGSVVV